MTREEAIELLEQYSLYSPTSQIEEALDMAIEALKADSVSRKDTVTLNSPISIQAEMVAVVRCKDCRYYWGNLSEDDTDEMYGECRWDTDEIPNADDFCSYGERREP